MPSDRVALNAALKASQSISRAPNHRQDGSASLELGSAAPKPPMKSTDALSTITPTKAGIRKASTASIQSSVSTRKLPKGQPRNAVAPRVATTARRKSPSNDDNAVKRTTRRYSGTQVANTAPKNSATESSPQPGKRKAPDIASSPSKKHRKDSELTDSELSELDATPEPPQSLTGAILEAYKLNRSHESGKVDEGLKLALAPKLAIGDSPVLPAPAPANNRRGSAVRPRVLSAAQWRLKGLEEATAVSSTSQDQSSVPDAKEVVSVEGIASTLRDAPSAPARRTRKSKVANSRTLATEDSVPSVRKAPIRRQSGGSKQTTGTRKRTLKQTQPNNHTNTTRRSKPANLTDISAEPFPTDIPIKQSRTRQTISDHLTVKVTSAASNASELMYSPAFSQSDVISSTKPIDPELLALSKALTHRDPVSSKPLPIGKPEVWAPGRQELCETLPYFQSGHSGCYANGGNVYGFMFDSASVGREYMDQDVIIARMGGCMAKDAKTGIIYQTENHDINDNQPQALLNNIAQRNPLVIICGSQNEGSVVKMPHRYCVLDWFKPTHVWAEKTLGRNGTVRTTIRYRFERLNRTKQPWYAATNHIDTPSELELPISKCLSCQKTCPQVYLMGWICTNAKCEDFWKLPDGREPYGELDYHPAFLLAHTPWERNDPPFSLNPGVPKIGQHFGDNLNFVNTRGVVCPDCGRCNTRYLFIGWRCDTKGCNWRLIPKHQVVMPSNLHHNPWDMASDGPSLIKSSTKPAIRTTIRYSHNYKVVKYTIDGLDGSVIVAKANQKVVSEPGGPDGMFREMQSADIGLERRMLRKTMDVEKQPSNRRDFESTEVSIEALKQHVPAEVEADAEARLNLGNADGDLDEEPSGNPDAVDDHHKAELGARMTAFGMNFGMPYKFIASGDSQSFGDAPEAIRAARSRLNWAQHVFVNDRLGYQDFNEELVFAYLEGQKIKYHDDGEKGLGPRIATLSLGAAATMSLRVKAKYFCPISNIGIFTDEQPLPLSLLESSGYTSGFRGKGKTRYQSRDTYEGRMGAWEELQRLKQAGNTDGYRRRAKELPKELDLHRKQAEAILSFHLTHGDIVIMEGEQIQKYLEHQVEPHGNLRFALTCRTVLPNHLTPEQLPPYQVKPDPRKYDGSAIRDEGDGEAVVW